MCCDVVCPPTHQMADELLFITLELSTLHISGSLSKATAHTHKERTGIKMNEQLKMIVGNFNNTRSDIFDKYLIWNSLIFYY